MRILIFGANGMAGHTISLYFVEQGHDVTSYSLIEMEYCNSIVADVTDWEKVKNVVASGNYDAVINCVGLLNENANNNIDKSILINSYFPHYLENITRNLKTKVIQMSTDCVFLGDKGNYDEKAFPDGETIYDRTKALGEIRNSKDLTFRNSIIGPDLNENGIGLFNWFMKQTSDIQGYTNVFWTGVTTLTLAKAMERAMSEKITGIYHLVNNQSINKYDLLHLFNLYFKSGEIQINKSDIVKSKKTLINTRTDFSFEVPTYQEMLKEMKEWVENHIDYYKHYKEVLK